MEQATTAGSRIAQCFRGSRSGTSVALDKGMTKRYRKGDRVTVVTDWDRKGTTSYHHLTVHSCGRIQMVLVNDAGEKFKGAHFRPDSVYVHPRMTDDEAIAKGLELGLEIIGDDAARTGRQMAHYANERISCLEGYLNHSLRDLNELHEPRVDSYPNLCNAIQRAHGLPEEEEEEV